MKACRIIPPVATGAVSAMRSVCADTDAGVGVVYGVGPAGRRRSRYRRETPSLELLISAPPNTARDAAQVTPELGDWTPPMGQKPHGREGEWVNWRRPKPSGAAGLCPAARGFSVRLQLERLPQPRQAIPNKTRHCEASTTARCRDPGRQLRRRCTRGLR